MITSPHSPQPTAHSLDGDVSCDVAISGGGLVGASLALMLAKLDLRVALIEAAQLNVSQHPSFDDRTTALSNGSRRIFEQIGVWPLIERESTPIRRIHVSDKGRFAFARLDAAEQGIPALGHVVFNRVMGAALWHRLREEKVELIAPATVRNAAVRDNLQHIECERADGKTLTLSTQLAIAADGAKSTLRSGAGIEASSWDYEQTAIVTNLLPQRLHEHVAYERFTAEGPIAVLPMTDGRVGIIWTVAPDAAKELLALDDAAFLARLQEAFGLRLGRFMQIGSRQSYPLSLTRSAQHVSDRLAIVGNAAQGLHPIAGQGFNLGLRDAACLAEVLADAQHERGVQFDPGSSETLQRYADWRQEDRRRIVGFTDGLVRLFRQPLAPVRLARDFGLLAFDLMPFAKDALSQLSLGAAGRVPRLARGVALR
jgi:2-octaprenyl-6-methoxyphenol hydroxylase